MIGDWQIVPKAKCVITYNNKQKQTHNLTRRVSSLKGEVRRDEDEGLNDEGDG